jgi:AcrR family transcriptional regulator
MTRRPRLRLAGCRGDALYDAFMSTSPIAARRIKKSGAALNRNGAAPREEKSDRPQLTQADWVRAATDVLVHHSVEAVRIELLARQLGVTRGSFYWHFMDRPDLLLCILKQWQDEQTERVIARYKDMGIKSEALVEQLVALPFHGRAAEKGAAIELAIRAGRARTRWRARSSTRWTPSASRTSRNASSRRASPAPKPVRVPSCCTATCNLNPCSMIWAPSVTSPSASGLSPRC